RPRARRRGEAHDRRRARRVAARLSAQARRHDLRPRHREGERDSACASASSRRGEALRARRAIMSSVPDAGSNFDVVLLHSPTDDGAGVKVLRARPGQVEAGEVRPVREGQAINGTEIVTLKPREGTALCDVETVMPKTAKTAKTAESAPVAAKAA